MCLFILLFFLIVGCSNTSTQVSNPVIIKNIKIQSQDSIIYKKFEYPINSKDASDFAYEKVTNSNGDTLFDFGIKSIAIYGDYCFFVDEAYTNVKKINLNNGIKTVSNKLIISERTMLVDIAIHNNLVYVTSNQKEIFVLDSDLKLLRTIELRTQGYNNMLFNDTKENNILVLICDEDTLIEIDPLGKEINRKKVNPYYEAGDTLTEEGVRFGEMYHDTVVTNILDKELYFYTYFEKNEDSYIRGKKYMITEKGGKDVFVNDKSEIKLAYPYTHLENTDIRFINDLDFDDNYLVIFEVTPPSITIHVYTISQ